MATASKQLVIRNATLSFPHLAEPSAYGDGEAKYSLAVIIDKDDPQAGEIEKAAAAVEKEQWKGKPVKLLSNVLHDGSEKADIAGYGPDVVFLTAKSKTKVKCVDKLKREVEDIDSVFYPGCKVNVVINIYAQDNKYGKRINAGLNAVQFAGDGEPLGGARVDVDAVFDAIESEDDASSLL